MKFKLAFLFVTAVALALFFGARAQPASAETTVTTSPFSFIAICPSEQIAVTGEYTLVSTSSTNPTGGSSAHFTFVLSGGGVGTERGTAYTLQGVSASGFYFRDERDFSRTADFFMFVQTGVLVPEGGGEPLSFQETLVAVFNAQGDLVSFQFVGGAQCQ
jgi:hypothetical protein